MDKTKMMLNKTNLKDRGWTNTLVKLFLPTCDDEVENPYHRSGPPIKRFNRERVLAIEAGSEFQEAMSRSEKRKQGAQKAIETKIERMEQWAESLPPVELHPMDKATLQKKAVDHYNSIWDGYDENGRFREENCRRANGTEDDQFLDRITVNYIPHSLTGYEERLLKTRGKVGSEDARNIIRSDILNAIASAYPWLEKECKSQDVRRYKSDFFSIR